MDAKPVTFESSLLFGAPVTNDATRLVEDLTTIFEAHDLPSKRIDTRDPSYLLFDCGEIQVLLAACDRPLEVSHFLDAARPPAAMLQETQILARLTSHTHSITVLVAERPGQDLPQCDARDETKEALCWQVTEYLNEAEDAALVFWCEDDTLYAGEEFKRAGLFGVAQLPTLDDGIDAIRAAEQRVDEKHGIEARAMTYIQTQIVQGAHRTSERVSVLDRMSAEIERIAPPALAAIEMAKRNGQNMMRGATMACSTAAAGICTMPLILQAIT
ncbi:hypothetical protein [Psychromarinibacter sp. S121]|uniref:hypothetical protein n=1 Tax=Psychromarinibacter sp. S121 TaxID=3415127 RepID=UPI003C7B3FB5